MVFLKWLTRSCIYQNTSWNLWPPGTVLCFPKTCLGAHVAGQQVGTGSSHYHFLPVQIFVGFQSEHPVWRELAGNPGQPLFWRRWYRSFFAEGVHSTSLQLLGGWQSNVIMRGGMLRVTWPQTRKTRLTHSYYTRLGMPGLCLSSCSASSLHLGFSFLLPDAKKTTHRYYPKRPLWASYPAMPAGTTVTDTSEMLQQRLVIPLQINLSRLLGTCQLWIDHLCPKLRLAHPAAPRAGDSKKNTSTHCLGGDGTDSSGNVQFVAELLPPQLVQRASWASAMDRVLRPHTLRMYWRKTPAGLLMSYFMSVPSFSLNSPPPTLSGGGITPRWPAL